MQTMAAIKTRRSVKHYDANHHFSDEQVKELFSLAMLSPTAFNIQNWRFVNVTKTELRTQIRAAAWDQVDRRSHAHPEVRGGRRMEGGPVQLHAVCRSRAALGEVGWSGRSPAAHGLDWAVLQRQ